MSTITYHSIDTYYHSLGNGLTYTVTFPYLFAGDVRVYVNEVRMVEGLDYTWTAEQSITLTEHPATDSPVVFRRFTRIDQRWAEYHNGATLTENDLNVVTLQLLYLIQEMYDYGIAGDSGNPPPGGTPGTPDDDGNVGLIDEIVDRILNSQLMQDLLELIELLDINAEATIAGIIEGHQNWSQATRIIRRAEAIELDIDARAAVLHELVDQNAATIVTLETSLVSDIEVQAQRIDLVAADLNDATALIGTVQTAVATLDSATASRFTLVEADVSSNTASIGSLDLAVATETNARALQYSQLDADITTVDSRVTAQDTTLREVIAAGDDAVSLRLDAQIVRIDENQGDITNLQETRATHDQVSAEITTELNAAFAPTTFDDRLNASSVIQGVLAVADDERASVHSLTSYLVGSGFTRNADGSIDWSEPTTGSLAKTVSGLQTTTSGWATQLATEMAFRTAMASYFSPGSQDDPPALVAAMQNAWRTYADEESAVAQRTSTLEANLNPIFFRTVAPQWNSAEFENMPWYTAGFPAGATWFMQHAGGIRPYVWVITSTKPYYVADEEPVFGPYGSIPGMWVPNIHTDIAMQVEVARGAILSEVATTYVREDAVGVEFETRLQAVFGQNVATISERLGSFIEDDGSMYSTWNVRINQYSGDAGSPVIAGVGLGMQTDPTNPNAPSTSQFIVMADQFAVVSPPTLGSPLDGTVDLDSLRVPFVIDSESGTVGIDGTLIVSGSLRAYDGVMGRLMFGQLDANGALADPGGMRLVLPSSTNGFNLSSSASPFAGGANPQAFLMWAGSGTMNHNNATFYVDTDGNAKFDGDIQADNINGGFQNATPVHWGGSVVLSASPTELTQFTLDGPFRAGATHKPIITLTLNAQADSSNGVFRVSTQRYTGAGWTEITAAQLNQGSGHGINHAISVLAPDTSITETFRVTVQHLSGSPVTVQGLTGFVFGAR